MKMEFIYLETIVHSYIISQKVIANILASSDDARLVGIHAQKKKKAHL